MNPKESLYTQITAKFDAAIYGIRDSGIERIEDMAGKVVQRIRLGEIPVTAVESGQNHPAPTAFSLIEIPSATRPMYAGAFLLNIDQLMSLSSERIQADLVRSLSIADQYPFNGYQDRFRAIYTRACAVQKDWLTVRQQDSVVLDPRTHDSDHIATVLEGREYLDSDCGFDDWQKAIDEYGKQIPDEPVDLQRLVALRGDKAHFISARRNLLPMLTRTVLSQAREEYLALSLDRRADASAMALVGISLYSTPPNN